MSASGTRPRPMHRSAKIRLAAATRQIRKDRRGSRQLSSQVAPHRLARPHPRASGEVDWVPALYGTFVVKGGHIIVFTFILLFDPRREHSSVPTAVPLAVARGGGQGWRDSAPRRACP